MTIYLNIGSNIGNRLGNIDKAIACLLNRPLFNGATVDKSDVIETEPWGFQSENKFLNIGLAVRVGDNLEPESVLEETQAVERLCGSSNNHRDEHGGYADRIVDIDIIAIDELIYNSDRLTLPHPRMHIREFVLRPLLELSSGWRHPIINRTVKELIDGLSMKESEIL